MLPQGDSTAGGTILPQSKLINLMDADRLLASEETKLPQSEDARRTALTELARLCFILGEWGEKRGSEAHFKKGRHYAKLLCREQPQRAEGHYWLALNLAGLAEVERPRLALRLVPTIIRQLQTSLTSDDAYDEAGAHRTLGRIYLEAPPWPLSEGDVNESLAHLRSATEIAPANSTNHLYLAETLLKLGRNEEAARQLSCVLKSTRHAIGPSCLEEDKQQALLLVGR